MQDRELLEALFAAAVKAADPLTGIKKHLPTPPKDGRTVVIGAGKGAAQMAAALETVWDGPLSGVVVTRYGYGCETKSIEILEASHPVPDAAGLAGAKRLMEIVSSLGENDLLIALVLRWRLGTSACPAGRPDAGGRDRAERDTARVRRADLRHECRAQTSVDDQGRASGGGDQGARRQPHRFRYTRRQPGLRRFRTDHSRRHDPAGCASDRRAIQAEPAGRDDRPPQFAGSGCTQAG